MTKLVNRAKMTTATTGTGDITLGSAVDGYQSFSAAGITDGDTVRYVIEDGNAWEIGLGTYTSSGTTLTRQVLESSAGGSAINLSGDAIVFVAAAGADFLSTPQSSADDGQMDLSSSSYFKAALTTDTLFEPVNALGGGSVQNAFLEVSASQFTRNADVNNAEPETVQLNLTTLVTPNQIRAAQFSSDGTRLFVVEEAFGPVILHQVDLATAFDLSTATYSGVVFSNSDAWGFALAGSLVFSSDGLRLFVSNSTGADIAQYTLTTAFDLGSVTYDTTVQLSDLSGIQSGIRFSSDGTLLFAGDAFGVNSYSLGTAYDLSTLTTFASSNASFDIRAVSFEFSDDGTTLVVGSNADTTPSIQYSLSTAFDITTLSLDGGVELSFDTTPRDIDFSSDGLSLFALRFTGSSIVVAQYTLTTAFDIAGAAVKLVDFNVSDSGAATTDDGPMRFSADGSKMFVGGQSDTIFQFSLTAAFDLRTASYDGVSQAVAGVEDFAFSNDGTKLFVSIFGSEIKQYSLGSAYDLTSVTEDAASYSFDGSVVVDTFRLAFNDDGTKLYVPCLVNGSFDPVIAEYTLATGFRLDSVTFEGFVAEGTMDPSAAVSPLIFSPDGTRIFSIAIDRAIELFLPTPYDVSRGAVVENSFTVISEFPDTVAGAAFSATGDQLFLFGFDDTFVDQRVVSYDTQVTETPLVVFPGNFEFPDGTAPSGPSSPNQTSLFSLSTSDEGATFLCRKVGDFS